MTSSACTVRYTSLTEQRLVDVFMRENDQLCMYCAIHFTDRAEVSRCVYAGE